MFKSALTEPKKEENIHAYLVSQELVAYFNSTIYRGLTIDCDIICREILLQCIYSKLTRNI